VTVWRWRYDKLQHRKKRQIDDLSLRHIIRVRLKCSISPPVTANMGTHIRHLYLSTTPYATRVYRTHYKTVIVINRREKTL
jgi:hypothetical protein